MNQAWELLFEGKIEEAKKLVSETFSLETCKDYSLLNLWGISSFFKKLAIRSEHEKLKTY